MVPTLRPTLAVFALTALASCGSPDPAGGGGTEATADTATAATDALCVPTRVDCTNEVVFQSGGATQYVHSVAYDSCGLPESAERTQSGSFYDDQTYTWVYDDRHHLLELRDDRGSDGTIDHVERYETDEAGRWLTRRYDEGDDGVDDRAYTYTYDAEGLLIELSYVSDTSSYVDIYGYDAQGRLVRLETDDDGDAVPDHVEVGVWDDAGVTYDVDLQGDGAVDWFRREVYDGEQLVEETVHDATTGALTWRETYAYDSEGRPTLTSYDVDGDGVFDSEATHSWSCP